MYSNNHIPDPVHSVRSKKYQLLYDSSFVQFVINTQYNGVRNLRKKIEKKIIISFKSVDSNNK